MSTERTEGAAAPDDQGDDARRLDPHEASQTRQDGALTLEEGEEQGDLIDTSPPPLDRPVIVAPSPEQKDRSWLLRVVVISFGAAIIGAWSLAAFLPSDHWKQAEPLVTRGVELLATLVTVIIGFYFGSKQEK